MTVCKVIFVLLSCFYFMKFELIQFDISEKRVLTKMLYPYLKEIEPLLIKDIAFSDFFYQYLDLYWKEANRIPLKIQSGTQILGFVLINDFIKHRPYKADWAIAEFYIKPAFRLKNIGKKVAFQIFDTYGGKWEVRQSASNHSAIKFWHKIIKEYTQNSFAEVSSDEEITQLFHSR